jgi:hypothetical protein
MIISEMILLINQINLNAKNGGEAAIGVSDSEKTRVNA